MAAGATPFDNPISPTNFSTTDEQMDPTIRTPGFALSPTPDDRPKIDPTVLTSMLNSYFQEAENARETGFNPRHEVWEENLHSFWMRRDHPDKRPWQSQEVSTMVPNFVERFAAQHRQALTQSTDWLEVRDPKDKSGMSGRFLQRLTRLALDYAGTNASGQPVAFEHDFGNMCQTGALMMMCAAVTFDHRNGRVLVEQVDPRQYYADPSGRGLYRVRFWEVDKETLLRQAEMSGQNGAPLYDVEAIKSVAAHHDQEVKQNKQDSSGAGQELYSTRTPILLKEWLIDLIDEETGKVYPRQVIVTADDHTIIRGPEPNPWWHGKDWVVAHPILQAPLKSLAGRTYVELFRPDVETHENVVNRILDMLSTSSMNATEVNPELLDDPEAVMNGIAPNQTILRDIDAPPNERAIQPIELGRTLSADYFRVWEATRKTAQESAGQSDLSLGQTSSGEKTATEVAESSQGQGSLNNSISMDIDLGFLGPIGELVAYTALQFVSEEAKGIWNALSTEDQSMLKARRGEFRNRPYAIRARGLTRAAERSRRIRGLLGALNVIGGNPALLQSFMKEYSVDDLIVMILEDFGVPIDKIELSEEEKFAMEDKRRQLEAKQRAQEASVTGQGFAPGSPAGEGGGGGGLPNTANNQGGMDPLAQGAIEGLPGGTG